MLHRSPNSPADGAPRLSNLLLHEILTVLRALPQHAKPSAAAQKYVANVENLAETVQQILRARLASDTRKGNTGGNPKASGRAPTLYYGECEQRGSQWLPGVAAVAAFMGYGNANSCGTRLAQNKREWLDRTILLDGRETVVAVRRATPAECEAYAAQNAA